MSEIQGPSRRYCCLVNLSPSDAARIIEVAKAYSELIRRWSDGVFEPLCRSTDSLLFGSLFRSGKPLDMMRAEFQRSPATRNGDAFIVFEVGEDFIGSGFSRAWTWLQRH